MDDGYASAMYVYAYIAHSRLERKEPDTVHLHCVRRCNAEQLQAIA
jgi:hypothetical protein